LVIRSEYLIRQRSLQCSAVHNMLSLAKQRNAAWRVDRASDGVESANRDNFLREMSLQDEMPEGKVLISESHACVKSRPLHRLAGGLTAGSSSMCFTYPTKTTIICVCPRFNDTQIEMAPQISPPKMRAAVAWRRAKVFKRPWAPARQSQANAQDG